MKNKILFSGHVKVNSNLLEEVIKDIPSCQGRKEYRLCTFSNVECHKQCYESISKTCLIYKYLTHIKSYNDKFGVVLR